MTRINVAIYPQELPDKLLLAELREIKRIPNQVSKGKYNLNDIPDKFKLGSGHVKFFYNKLLYLKNRYLSLYNEAISRGFDVTDFSGAWNNVPEDLMADYIETENDRILLIERITERGFKLL